jgi:hypothetical protein
MSPSTTLDSPSAAQLDDEQLRAFDPILEHLEDDADYHDDQDDDGAYDEEDEGVHGDDDDLYDDSED